MTSSHHVSPELLQKQLRVQNYGFLKALLPAIQVDAKLIQSAFQSLPLTKEDKHLTSAVLKHSLRHSKKLTPDLEIEIDKIISMKPKVKSDAKSGPHDIRLLEPSEHEYVPVSKLFKLPWNLRHYKDPNDPARKVVLEEVKGKITGISPYIQHDTRLWSSHVKRADADVIAVKHGYYDCIERTNRKMSDVINDAIYELIEEDDVVALDDLKQEYYIDFKNIKPIRLLPKPFNQNKFSESFLQLAIMLEKPGCIMYLLPLSNNTMRYGTDEIIDDKLRNIVARLIGLENMELLDKIVNAFNIPLNTIRLRATIGSTETPLLLPVIEKPTELVPVIAYAASHGKKTSVKHLLNIQDVNAANENGFSALACATMNKHYDLIPMLIHAGADPAIQVINVKNADFPWEKTIKKEKSLTRLAADHNLQIEAGIKAILDQGIFGRQQHVTTQIYSENASNVTSVKHIAGMISEYDVCEFELLPKPMSPSLKK